MVTGTSVLGIKYASGIMLAADTLASYGSLAQIRDMKRLVSVGDYTIIGAGGDMSDWQAIQDLLDQLVTEEYTNDDGISFGPEHLHEYLARVLYY
jgi:20S proteasome subunit beta 7